MRVQQMRVQQLRVQRMREQRMTSSSGLEVLASRPPLVATCETQDFVMVSVLDFVLASFSASVGAGNAIGTAVVLIVSNVPVISNVVWLPVFILGKSSRSRCWLFESVRRSARVH